VKYAISTSPLRGSERNAHAPTVVSVSRTTYHPRRIGACCFVKVGRLVANISRGVVQQPDRLYRLSIFCRLGRKAGVNASRQNRKYAGGKAGAAFWLGETDDDNRAGLWHLIEVS